MITVATLILFSLWAQTSLLLLRRTCLFWSHDILWHLITFLTAPALICSSNISNHLYKTNLKLNLTGFSSFQCTSPHVVTTISKSPWIKKKKCCFSVKVELDVAPLISIPDCWLFLKCINLPPTLKPNTENKKWHIFTFIYSKVKVENHPWRKTTLVCSH